MILIKNYSKFIIQKIIFTSCLSIIMKLNGQIRCFTLWDTIIWAFFNVYRTFSAILCIQKIVAHCTYCKLQI